MPTVNGQTFAVAAATEPLVTPGTNSLLQDSDPAIFFSLDFWSWLIGFFPGPRLLSAASAAGVSSIASAVAQRYPYQPDEYLTSDQAKFPLLSVYRKDSTYTKHSAGYYTDRCTFDLIYVLPPLTAGQSEAILPILRSVERTIREKTVQSFDPGYTPPGGSAGQSPWSLPFCAVQEIGFDQGHRGMWPGKGNLFFPFLHMEGYFLERDMYVPSTTKFAGGDIEIDLVAPDGGTIPQFIQASTQQAPTVTSLSVSTGSIAGGTSVTLTGTLFLPGVLNVMFGSTPAPRSSIVWNSATSVSCRTPAISGPGSVSVVLVNRDGQAGIGPAFTYTSP